MKRIIRFLEKATTIITVPFFLWLVSAQILVHICKRSIDSLMNGWFGDIGLILILCSVGIAFPWIILRALAYEDKQ